MFNKETTIIEPFSREIWRKFKFREIKELSKNKSDNYVHSKLKKFVKLNVLKQERVGNVLIYSVVDSVNALNYVGAVAEYIALNDLGKYEKILKNFDESYFSFVFSGNGYFIICDSKKGKNILSEKEFFEKLLDSSDNSVKKIVRNGLVATGAKQYFSIIMRAVNNAFKG